MIEIDSAKLTQVIESCVVNVDMGFCSAKALIGKFGKVQIQLLVTRDKEELMDIPVKKNQCIKITT